MLIDWFTVVAQIVNFLVLVALLKHFLYGRLVRGDGRAREAHRGSGWPKPKKKIRRRRSDVSRAPAMPSSFANEREQMLRDARTRRIASAASNASESAGFSPRAGDQME